MLQDSALVRLQHMCDAVIVLEAFREDSGIARLISDASRCYFLPVTFLSGKENFEFCINASITTGLV